LYFPVNCPDSLHIVRVVLPALEAARFKAREYPLKSSWFPAIFVVPLIILSIACGAGQPIDETLQPTVHVNPTVTPEHQKVPKSQPTMSPTRTDPLKPTSAPDRQGKAQPIPTDAPGPTPNASLPKTVVVIKTPTPRPEPSPTPPPEKKVFDRSHHVATAADLVKLADPDTKKALLNPVFFDVSEAKAQYTDSELVIGLSVNGQHRAYSTSFMATWIVNDTVGGDPLLVTY
jgi:hypothetical protein